MKTTIGKGLAIRAVRWSGCALAVAALALGAAAIGRAQTPSGGTKPPQKTAAPAAQKAAKPSGQSGGMNTGIKVHGHWTIDVLTKDGKLVSHHEFENNLANGAPLFSNILGGQATPGGLAILLLGTACPNYPLYTLGGSIDGICPIVAANSAMAASSYSSGYYMFTNPPSTACLYVGYICQGNNSALDYWTCYATQLDCSTNLTASTYATGNGVNTSVSLTLSGSYPLVQNPYLGNTQPGETLSAVAVTGYACSSGVSIITCQSPPTGSNPLPTFPMAFNTSVSGVNETVYGITVPITYTGLATPIGVSNGQIIQVTVVISFS